jgi:carbamoyl-phosphate synthase large subunit
MLEHVEHAGVHSGDAGMVLPPHTLSASLVDEVRRITHSLAKRLGVVGLMNVQFAIKDGVVYMLEVNPRASRTVPFVSKAIGVPLAKLASLCMMGAKLKDLGFTREIRPPYWAVKESVFPFSRFPGAPVALSPEMRSTGEVMGVDDDLGMAYAKAQMAAQPALPLGFTVHSTSGTAAAIEAAGVKVNKLGKISEGARPNALDLLKNGQLQMIVNTAAGMLPRKDENAMRSEAVLRGVYMASTMNAARAAVLGIRSLKQKALTVSSLQEHAKVLPPRG